MRDPRVIASDITGPILFEGDRIAMPGLTGFLNGGDPRRQRHGHRRRRGGDGRRVRRSRRAASRSSTRRTSTARSTRCSSFVARARRRRSCAATCGCCAAPTAPPSACRRWSPSTPRGGGRGRSPAYLDCVPPRRRRSRPKTTCIVDNNYGRFEAGANVRLQGTVARPGVTGRAELREGGEMFLLGGLYRLNESSISFTNPTAIEPDMNISMVTRSNGDEHHADAHRHARPPGDQRDVEQSRRRHQTVMSVLLGGNSARPRGRPGAALGRAARA